MYNLTSSFKSAKFIKFLAFLLFLIIPVAAFSQTGDKGISVFSIDIRFVLFGLTLVGVALFHKQTMYVALIGFALILLHNLFFVEGFSFVHHIIGGGKDEGEWRTLLNLAGLLFGFAILAKHFEESNAPEMLRGILPSGWPGALLLLFLIMVISSFLDNIAAAMIGGTIAYVVFDKKVHIGFLAAIVAASNAGGAGSVVGDTTTTLMWIDGVSPLDVTHAFIGSIAAFAVFGTLGAYQQNKHSKIIASKSSVKMDWGKIIIVVLTLTCAIITNAYLDFPAVGVCAAILIGATFRKTPWKELVNAWQGAIFLIALVSCASLMPVDELPSASWKSAFILGFVSAVFDNIPLTKLCLEQGGYDWGMLAYSVGFGGSMIWFGSSAGVALSNKYPEARSAFKYIKHGWHVIPAYVIGFFAILWIAGWNPHAPHKETNKTTIEISTDNKQPGNTN